MPSCNRGALSGVAVVRKLRLFVHLGADAVAHELAHHREAVLLDPLLHGGRNIAEPIARAALSQWRGPAIRA